MKKTSVNDMTQGKPIRLILAFMLPVLLGNWFQTFYNLVDTMIVGRFVGVNALAAVGSTGSIMFCVQGLAQGMTSGFGVILAQYFGAGKQKDMRHYMAMSIYLCVIITLCATALLIGSASALLQLMNTPDTIFREARTYLVIIYGGIGANFLYNMAAAILRSMGDSKTPLYFLIFSSVLNIILDLLFVRGFAMGVAGAAGATVISQAVSGFLCLLYMIRNYPQLHVSRDEARWNLRAAGKLLEMGIPMALQFSITALGTMIVQSALNLLGATAIAAYTAAQKIQSLIVQPCVSMGTTMATFVGQNAGAGRMDRIREGMRKAVEISVAMSLISMALALPFGKYGARLFLSGPTEDVLTLVNQYFWTAAWFYIPLGLIFVYRNSLQGLGDGLVPMLGGVFELAARGLLVAVIHTRFGFAGICAADPAAWVSALIPLIPVYYLRMRRRARP